MPNNGYATPKPKGIYFLVGRRTPPMYGYVWRVWAQKTSFYIKPRHASVGGQKISLHGPDPRPNLSAPGYKLALDGLQPDETAIVATPGFLPCWFPGHGEEVGLVHVVRICVPWLAFQPGVPPGPPADAGLGSFQAVLLEIPKPGTFAVLDLYISDRYPKWPRKREIRGLNALTHPLRNEAGQYLLGVTKMLSMASVTLPDALIANPPADARDTVRGIGAAIDPRGFAWLTELPMSRRFLAGADPRTM